MNIAMPEKQRGVTFGGAVFGAFLLVVGSIFALKLVPAYMEDAKIKNIFETIAHDPDMQKASTRDIRNSFEKRAAIDGIQSIKGDDIEVTSEGGRPYLSATYSVKVPLGGNVSLLMEFKPTSAQ